MNGKADTVNRTVEGTYGRGTPCRVFVVALAPFARWYCVEGSENVNLTDEEIHDGVNVEGLTYFQSFTWDKPIESVEELYNAVMD